MDSNLVLRPAVLEDWAAINHCFLAASQAAWSGFLPQAWFEGQESAPGRWYEVLARASEDSRVLAADYFNELAGFSVMHPSEDHDRVAGSGEVDAFYVNPHHWGLGIGQALMKASVEFLQPRYVTSTLWTEVRNERPIRFYSLQGWVPDGTHRTREVRDSVLTEMRLRI